MVQDSVQILGDALEEYYQANEGKVIRPEQLPESSRALFRNHDICHVIFGLDTTPEDEAMADVRALVSSTVGWRRYGTYLARDKAARAIFRKVGLGDALVATLRATPRAVRVLFQALTTRKRWPWDAPDRFLIRSLKHLRREYHIKVI